MPDLIAPHDCDLPTLGLRVKAGEVVTFPDDGSAPAWEPAKPKTKGSTPATKEP